jgi:2,4-dienoyl-CoA reductase-like NADH-dependent reductase (Old Yellow Enzyme family)
MIIEAEQTRDIVEQVGKEPQADVVLVARQFLREPDWVLRVAWTLGVDVWWPS